MDKAYEIVRTSRIRHLNIFINELEYRTSHMHREFEILLVLKNELAVTFPESSFILEEGDAMMINPSQVHMLKARDERALFICIQFSPSLFKDIFPQLSSMRFESGNMIETRDGDEMKRTILELSRTYLDLDESMNLEILSKLSHLVYLMTRNVPMHMLTQKEKAEEDRHVARISRLLDYIEQNYTNRINLSDFAESEGLTLSYASRFARKVLSESFQDYVNSLRFNYAKQLISDRNMSVSEAAFEAGFSDPRYLSRTFEREMGIKASAYRKLDHQKQEDGMKIHMSAHSMECLYSRRKAIDLLEDLMKSL